VAWANRLSRLARKRRGVSAWALAAGFFAMSLLARFALSRWLDPIPFITFYPAIVASTLVCGWRQGTAVLLLSAMAAWYFYLAPAQSFVFSAHVVVALLSFLAVGGFDVLLVAALAELVRRLEESKDVQESLARELQHRVANNMQMVIAMLRNGRRALRDSVAVDVIDQVSARIAAMAQLHRRLCDRNAYTNGLAPILQDVLADVFYGRDVDLKIDISVGSLPPGQMTAILLLVNEAAMNAAKHVFSKGQGSFFAVSLSERADGRRKLTIRDDGSGIASAPLDVDQSRTLGMGIMQALASQLGGALEVQFDRGMKLSVEFAIA
jgi:two-component sensor histidine kinase